MNSPLSTALRPLPQWPVRDLIRLWPWLLPFVLAFIFAHDGFRSVFSAWATVWMSFFIVRRLWGHHRAHSIAMMLVLLFGVFSFGEMLMPDMVSCFLTLAAIYALVHRHKWASVIAVGIGLYFQGAAALLTPVCAGLGWWLAGGLHSDGLWWPTGSLRARRGLLLGLLPLLLAGNSPTVPALLLQYASFSR